MSPANPSIGEMDRKILVRELQESPGIGSTVDQALDPGVPAWARLQPVGAALFYGTAQVESGVTHRAATWRTSQLNELTVTAAHVVDCEGVRYRVKRASDVGDGRRYLLIDLEQLGVIP